MASKIAGTGSASIGCSADGGDVLSVALQPISTVESDWEISISAKLPNGSLARVGTVRVEKRTAATSSRLAQIVAGAYCPGALEWFLDLEAVSDPTAQVIVSGSTGKGCGPVADRAWAWTLRADGIDLDTAPKRISPLATDHALVAGPAWRFSAWGISTDAAADRYVVIVDSATVPAPATPTLDAARALSGLSWTLEMESGEKHTAGVFVGYSDTATTYTPPVSGNGTVRVAYKPIRVL